MKRRLRAVIAVLLATMSINAATIFQDDFSNPGTSNTNWNPSGTSLTKSFTGGECSVTNTSTDQGVLLIHEIDNLPSSFTFSAKINGGNDGRTGFYFCLGLSGQQYVGYQIKIENGSLIVVQKFSSVISNLVSIQSGYITSGYNEIKVSRNGSKFNVFCNNQFVSSFTDSEFSSGDIAMILAPGASANFDDVLLTDQFQDHSIRTCFADDFDDGDLLGWINYGSGSQATVQDKSLKITTSNQTLFYYINLELVNFVTKVTVSHRSGSKSKPYGLYLQGSPDNSDTTLSSGFLIIGNRMYGVFTPSVSEFNLYSSQKIMGAAYTEAGQTYYSYDTLEVSKQQSTGYIFKVNNSPLCTVPEIGFKVSSIGFYCSDSLDLLFDDFVAAEGTEAVCSGEPISIREKTGSRKMINITRSRPFIFDPLGRAIPDFTNIELKRSVSPGIYLRADQKKTLMVIEP